MTKRISSKRPSRRKPARKTARTKRSWRKPILLLFLFATLAGASWAAWVDFQIQRDFKALQWALPARIYARPLDLYEGARLSANELTAYLQRLGYRQTENVAGPGEYRVAGSRIVVRTRGFQFWDGTEAAVHAEVIFNGRELTSLRGQISGQDLTLMRLEPVEIAQINPETGEDRLPVALDEVPPELVQALIAVEDRRFYEHYGVDFRGILRAVRANITRGGIVQGGSTLTQQLVKNLYLTRDRTFRRKAEEAVMALSLELHFSKDDILAAYINEVHLGQDGNRAIHGFALAARHYFDRPLNELNLSELAVLAALPRGASYYNPLRYPERALERRNVVLARMQEQGFISEQQMQESRGAPLQLRTRQIARTGYPAFMDLVYGDLARDYDSDALRSTGLRIFTTLDVAMQDSMEGAISTSIADIERRLQQRTGQSAPTGNARLETAVVITDANNGDIRAVAGSRQPGYTGFNRALRASRPIGSLAKPAVYLAALESGRFDLATVLSDRPIDMRLPDGQQWRPRNFENQIYGDVYMFDALERSMNLATVDLGMQVGLVDIANTLSRLSHTRPIQPYPSMVLGAVNMVPVQVAQMYQTLASNGFRSPLRAVEAVTTGRGEPLERYGVATEQVADPAAVYQLEYAMQGSFVRGTARNAMATLENRMPLAGKTGTTNEARDSWFAGYGDDLVGVVWVGHDDNRETGLTGATGALRIWSDVMRALEVQPRQNLPPPGIEMRRVAFQPVRDVAHRDCRTTHTLPFRIDYAPAYAVDCGEIDRGGRRDRNDRSPERADRADNADNGENESLLERVIDRFRIRR